MPIFEYVCKQCRQHFEAVVYGAQKPECPSCHSVRLEQQLSVFAVGASKTHAGSRPAAAPCGTCGDPRGPGSCAMD